MSKLKKLIEKIRHAIVWIRNYNTKILIYFLIQKYLIGQIVAAALAVKVAFAYVDTHDSASINDAMGSMAAGAQIFSLVGGIYEIVGFF